jgi:hypothetical protein
MFGGQQQCRKQQATRPQNISFAKFRKKNVIDKQPWSLGSKEERARAGSDWLATHFR